ncbi:MAG TPA: hypothetical protein VFI52_01230 [Gemmatimonadaceae bacterium]|nr:hypothetical protein [Gemmatimonadaceae bacterium]
MILVPQLLTDLADPWAKFYSHSKVASTIVGFLHVAPIVVGGGLAIALDRSTLRLRHDEPGARARHLTELGTAHRVVLGSLALSFLSGVALFASDLETFYGSWVFWFKMGLIALLLVNGAIMTRLERSLRVAGASVDAQWGRLRTIAITSLTLWLTITLVGVVLTNIA